MKSKIDSSVLKHTPIFYNFERINPTISKVNVRVFYSGKNRNRSRISDEVAEQMAQSMLGTAIVGNYAEEVKDFDEHSGGYIVKDGELIYRHTAVPYGFVPTNAKIWKESIQDADGVIRDYYCTEGFLWTKRYPEAERVLTNTNNQSMELDDETVRGSWSKEEDGMWYDIEYADILGLCILGEDVAPCFPSASFYSFSDYGKEQWTEFSNLVSEMLEDIKGEVEFKDAGAEQSKDPVLTFNNHEPEKIYKVYTTGIVNKFNKGGNKMAKEMIQFELSHDNIRSMLYKAINPYNKETDSYNWSFSIQDVYDNYAIIYNYDESKYYKMGYSKADETVTTEKPIEVFSEFLTSVEKASLDEMRGNYSKFKETVEGLEGKEVVDATEYSTMKSTVEGLTDKTVLSTTDYTALKEQADSVEGLNNQIKEYSEAVVALETEKKEGLLTEFAVLGEEVLAPFKEKITEFSYVDLEKELSVLGYKNKVNYSAQGAGGVITYSGDGDAKFDNQPEWVKSVLRKQNKRNEEE